jgi:hypothetical protein
MKTFHLRGGNPGCDGGTDHSLPPAAEESNRDQGPAPDTVLVFAILAGLGVAVTGWALLGHRGSQVHP